MFGRVVDSVVQYNQQSELRRRRRNRSLHRRAQREYDWRQEVFCARYRHGLLQTTLNAFFVGKTATAVIGMVVSNLLVRSLYGLISSRVETSEIQYGISRAVPFFGHLAPFS